MEMLEQYLPYLQNPMVLNGLGGAVLGPILAKVLRGSGGTGFLGGLVGGVAAGFGADAADLSTFVSGESTEGMMVYLQDLAEGAVGGGGLGLILGGIIKRH